jgi:acyl dehydratase
LTLALASALSDEVMAVGNSAMAVNYGLERVRFPAPLRVGASVRAAVEIVAAEPIPNGIHLVRKLTFEANDAPKPVCVAVTVARYFV